MSKEVLNISFVYERDSVPLVLPCKDLPVLDQANQREEKH
jgi:hypothetical protein